MLATFQLMLFGAVLASVTLLDLVMPSITRRDLLFGVTVAPNARATAAGRAIIRGYRLAVGAIAVGLGAALGLLYALAPAAWWDSGGLSIAGLIVALLPGAPYIPAHLAARRLAAADTGDAPTGTRAPLADPRPRRYGDYVPWVWEALPLGIIGATVAYLATTYPAAPAIIAIHFNAAGQPNGYATKTIGTYFSLVWTQIGMELGITAIALLIARSKAQPENSANEIYRRRGLRYLYAVKMLTIALLGALAAWIAHAALGRATLSPWLLPATLGFVLVVVGLGVVVALRTGQGGAQLAGAGPTDRMDDRYWKGGVIYANRDDPAIFVERRYGFGWTLNVANPRAWLAIVGIVALLVPLPLLPLLLSGGAR
ncbi:MAG: DUF1648 domain-containing protein [Ktedonobacterales bacterium]|nr:DUF1648 domain-containing protein [Ktedonobacterales bacterium]